ncbi:hypothetical protein, partial [Roseateles sp.]|uniref:hypothetical protein n=1 Tax=Roseateles sp. TaxID=1971397 RepID=UPI003BA6A3C7
MLMVGTASVLRQKRISSWMRALRGWEWCATRAGGLEETLLKAECRLGTLPPCRCSFAAARRGFWWLLVTDCRASQAGRSGRSARWGFSPPLWFRFEHGAGYPTDAEWKNFKMWQIAIALGSMALLRLHQFQKKLRGETGSVAPDHRTQLIVLPGSGKQRLILQGLEHLAPQLIEQADFTGHAVVEA